MARVCVDSTYFEVLPDGRLTLKKTGLGKIATVAYTTPGASAFLKATYPSATRIKIMTVGGGGGGSGSAALAGELAANAGGGGGGYSERWVDVSALAVSETVTVGAAGTGGLGTNNGNPGGASSFGTWCIANGGPGGGFLMASGTTPATVQGVSGASPGTGDITLPGMASFSAIRINNLAGTSGRGGDAGSGFGSGGLARSSGGNGLAATRYGGGGGGAVAVGLGGVGQTTNGSPGTEGCVFVEVWA